MSDTDPQQTVDTNSSELRLYRFESKTLLQLDVRSYQLIEELGRGGMGEVYRAGDPALGRDLAIKVMKTEYCGIAEAERRLLREARITGSLQHPGIVAVHNLGRLDDGRLHYTMRLVRVQTFADILKQDAGKPERFPYLLTIFEKICQAMAYAHSKRVLHRDLKPHNVMVGKFGEVQVMDWGLAKLLTIAEDTEPGQSCDEVDTIIRTESADLPSDLSRAGSSMGTPAYMSPEQAAGDWEVVDERADVFALGSILCQMLTGFAAYKGAGGNELLRRARRGDLDEAMGRLEQCGADAALLELCRDCLAADRLQRPRDAAVVAQRVADYQVELQERLRRAELERVAAETRAKEEQRRAAVEAERASEAQARAKAEQRAKRRMLALSLALAAILCLGGGGGWWIAHEKTARVEETMARLEADARVSEAATYFLRCEILYNKGRLNEAIPEYRKAIELQADNVEYWYMLADVLFDAGKWEESVAAYQTAIHLKPDYAVAHHSLGDALVKLDRTDQAIAAFQEAIRLEPDYAEAHNNLADCLRGKGQLDEAIAEFRKAIEVKPDYATPHNGLGNVLYDKGQWDQAIAEYREAVRLDPREASYRNNLGNSLRRKGQLNEAMAEYRIALQLKPDYAYPHNGLGNVLYDKGQLDEAAAEYRLALQLKPDYAYPHNGLGNVLDKKGQLDKAIAKYREAIRFNPRDAVFHSNLGNSLRRSGQLDEALVEYRKAIKLKPDYAPPHNGLANVMDDKGQLDKAIAGYREAIRLKPDDAMLHTNLGNTLWRMGQLDEARAEYRKAIQLKPDYAFAHNGLGDLLAYRGQTDEALTEYREVIRLKSDYAHAHSGMGAALLQQGLYAEAKKSLQRAVELLSKDDPNRQDCVQYLQNCDRFPGLEMKLSAILSGQEAPSDAGDAVALALMCQFNRRYVAAARLYADAFDKEPRLAVEPQRPHRYSAACCAVRAAAGQGEDARLLPDKVALMLRGWALNWLRDDLKTDSVREKQGNATMKQEIKKKLLRWRRDSMLASVREAKALDRLPDSERAAWQALWREVDELAKTAAR